MDMVREVYAESIFTDYVGKFNAALRYIQHYALVDASRSLAPRNTDTCWGAVARE